LSDRFRVHGIEECPNWTSTGNDRSGETDRNSWLAVTDRLRCDAGLQFSLLLSFNADGQYMNALMSAMMEAS